MKFNRVTPTNSPPITPIVLPTKTNIGSDTIEAIILGKTKYFIGSVDKVVRASSCSVTFIVPISAAIAAETLPATIKPPNTGPNSLIIPIATIDGTTLSALKRLQPSKICKARAPPVKKAVKPTTGNDV